MPYTAKVTVKFERPAPEVYEALCDLPSYNTWSPGLHVSYDGRMHEGLTYATTNRFAGKDVTSNIEIIKMVPDREISMKSASSLILFWSTLTLTELSPAHCIAEVNLKVEFSPAVITMSHPLVEALIEQNILEALEALSRKLAQPSL